MGRLISLHLMFLIVFISPEVPDDFHRLRDADKGIRINFPDQRANKCQLIPCDDAVQYFDFGTRICAFPVRHCDATVQVRQEFLLLQALLAIPYKDRCQYQ